MTRVRTSVRWRTSAMRPTFARVSHRPGLLIAACLALAVPAAASAAPTDLDSSFGTGGVTTTPIFNGGTRLPSLIQDVVAQEGSLLFAGSRYRNNNWEWVIGRYTANGTLDTAFNGGAG